MKVIALLHDAVFMNAGSYVISPNSSGRCLIRRRSDARIAVSPSVPGGEDGDAVAGPGARILDLERRARRRAGAVAVATFDSVLLMSTFSLEMLRVGERALGRARNVSACRGFGIPATCIDGPRSLSRSTRRSPGRHPAQRRPITGPSSDPHRLPTTRPRRQLARRRGRGASGRDRQLDRRRRDAAHLPRAHRRRAVADRRERDQHGRAAARRR